MRREGCRDRVERGLGELDDGGRELGVHEEERDEAPKGNVERPTKPVDAGTAIAPVMIITYSTCG
jgi:hypothetical protein